ncbi:MAG: hypothetical protein BJ554DRAFT_5247 [Olpidium bornovanus]|uniref:Uncharacterized protein n=1 Tax=Olpidium bornovanus TaxID=278681 RepID=A0A8H7ZLJ6_9FUNG|nr:MAG: hypothetical protein BJ554DRAFT_5247 [Olpidium bornovanus]
MRARGLGQDEDERGSPRIVRPAGKRRSEGEGQFSSGGVGVPARRQARKRRLKGQTSKTQMEVIAAVKREAEKYVEEFGAQQQIIAEEQSAFEDTMDNLSENYQRQIADIQAVIAEKDAQIKVSQEDLSLMKDFRLKRDELVKELEQLKTEIHENDRRHTEQITKMERRFFEEKVRLQKDANKKIQELAAKAHKVSTRADLFGPLDIL